VTGPDERNPLARALDEASGGAEARAFTISVEAVRAGARRRRARRTGVTSGLAALVVVAMAGGAYAGLPHLAGAPRVLPGPGPAPSSQVQADWPAQFLRCGQVVGDALPHLGGDVPVTVTDASSSIPADGPWSASVTVAVPAAPAGSSAVVWGTDLSVVRNGVVIGVQEGPATPDLSGSLAERLGPDGYLVANPFPVTTRVTRTLASCDQYPSGQGSPYLAPGSYTLVVTQTLSYATTVPAVDPALVDVRSSVTTSVTITAPAAGAGPSGLGATGPETTPARPGTAGPGSTSPGTATPGSASSGSATTAGPADLAARTGCGAPADDLAALVDAPGAPYTAALNPHPTPYGYANIPASPVLTPTPGRTVAHDLVDVANPVVVAIQGGTVVARSVVPNHPDAWTGGLTITFPDPPALTRCPGVPAPTDGGPGLQGDYALRLVVDVTVTGAEPGTWLIASAPLP